MISYPWLEEVAQKLDQLLSSKVLTLEGPKGLGKKEIAHEIAKHNEVFQIMHAVIAMLARHSLPYPSRLFSIILIANLLKLIKLGIN